jgi:hypothetical protein
MTFHQQLLADTATDRGLTEAQAMTALQDNRIISDNCLGFDDIANADCGRAADYLEVLKP